MKTRVLTPVSLYEHPDGFAIDYAENALIACDEKDNCVVVPIGKLKLLELSRKLHDIAQGMREAST